MIAALCPSFRRPRLTCNSGALFLEQSYPDGKGMVILEDGGALYPKDMGEIKVLTSEERYPDLGTKYNTLAERAIDFFDPDYFAVWEDDDIYLPHHFSISIRAMEEQRREWSMPSFVFTLLGGAPDVTNYGIYHASIVMSKKAWEKVHWDTSGQAKFDRILMDQLRERFGPPADPYALLKHPSYVFRFYSTHAYHGQAYMRSLEDTTWYNTVALLAPVQPPMEFEPKLDEETVEMLKKLRIPRKEKIHA